MSHEFSAIIVAAGSGTRLKASTPKAFINLGGQPLVTHSLACFDTHPAVGEIILVVHPHMIDECRHIVLKYSYVKPVTIVHGGEQRWQSARNGIDACSAGSDWVMIHDAARPFVSHPVIDALWATRQQYRCAVTATPVVDTIRRVEENRSVETIDRSKLVRVGTPQLFHRQSLIDAFRRNEQAAASITDEAMLMERSGIAVGIAPGDPLNFKITTPEDLAIAEALLAKTRDQ
jgi:2-C-methyl-D-erythritol 4-phosphate cytidylyltransferase